MTSLTLAEKLLSRAAGRKVRAGEIAVVRPDLAIGTDAAAAVALEHLARLDGGTPRAPFDARRLAFGFDRADVPVPTVAAAREAVRDYAARHGVTLFDVGEGIGHQAVLETGLARPGNLAVGVDAHAVCFGAMNAFATGIDAADLAGVMYCGQLWLRTPSSIRVELSGQLRPGVSARDLALALASRLGAQACGQRALEFDGSGVARLDLDDRIVLSGVAIETGAMAALFRCDQKTREFLAPRIGARQAAALVAEVPDPGARYVEMMAVDLGAIEPMVALPDALQQVVPLAVAPPTAIDTVYLGSCTGGSLKDYLEALAVLRQGGGRDAGVRLIVTPGSERVRVELQARGLLDEFIRFGAEVRPPGCDACGGCGNAALDGRNVASTANRPFQGRWRDAGARVYLASPSECARAAVTGRLGSVVEMAG